MILEWRVDTPLRTMVQLLFLAGGSLADIHFQEHDMKRLTFSVCIIQSKEKQKK